VRLAFYGLRFNISALFAHCHSSDGGECGERIEPVKDAIGRPEERPSQATSYGTGYAGASKLASLTGSTPSRR
jgi:hypothetical protein